MAPISTRTADQAGTAGNQVSAMVATLGTDIDDPRLRLAAGQESTHRSKVASQVRPLTPTRGSYCGQLMISVVSDRAMMPDPARYAQCIDESLAEMAEATT